MSVLNDLPGALGESHAITRLDSRFIARPTRRVPLVVESGCGALLTDVDGRELIDLTSGWNVANAGWNHPRIVAAAARQLEHGSFAPPWCTHRGKVEYAENLSDWIGGEWLAWCGVSGSEAVEAALKIARRATGRHAVVGFEHAYHGGTLGSMLAGGLPSLHGVDLPRDQWHRHAPIPEAVRGSGRDYAALARAVILAEPPPAAVLIEALFTNPGVIYGTEDFYQAVGQAAAASGALIIVDEIGTGFGRTGHRFAYKNWKLVPDIVVLGKAMTSGVAPMSAAIVRPDLAKAVTGAGFSATFGWTPLACAAAGAMLRVVDDEGLVERAAHLGQRARQALEPLSVQCPYVADVRGLGLEIGVELVSADRMPLGAAAMNKLTERLLCRGVFAEPSGYTSTLLIMPPLTISEEQLDHALSVVVEEIHALAVD
jgi:4-aminobutyrate aminotransferase-like enzyme